MPEATFGTENTMDRIGLNYQLGQLSLGKGTKTASATAGAATLHQPSGVITSEALTTAAAAVYTLTLTNDKIVATDIVLVSLGNGTNSAGHPHVLTVTPAAGSVVIVVRNTHASAALNGTLKIAFAVVKV
jgi:hypothetical protein